MLAEAEVQPYTALATETPPLHGLDQARLWTILHELTNLDIANMTPVQALVVLNELQSKLNQA